MNKQEMLYELKRCKAEYKAKKREFKKSSHKARKYKRMDHKYGYDMWSKDKRLLFSEMSVLKKEITFLERSLDNDKDIHMFR